MADHLDGDIQLTPRHGPFLVGHLSGNASVWRSLGTALQFQKGNLDNIQACLPLLSNSPYSFMETLVGEWLDGKYPHTAPPTLANLLKALNSIAVGLGTLATQIRDSLPQHDQSVGFEIASVSDKGHITFNRSKDIKVCENAQQVFLKVKIAGEYKACQFTWKNVGLVPISDELYSNIRPSALSISKADIDMDSSQYSCSLNLKLVDNDERKLDMTAREVHVTTTPVTLRVSCPQLDQFKGSLASIYLAQPEVPQDSWPKVSNKTYINLALIKQQQAINCGGEYARLTIRGDMDDILHHKEKIECKNVFDGLRSGSLLLIEGRPGSGKTMFVHKITRDWAASEVQGPMRLVLLVSLRVLNGWEKPVILEDILQLLSMQVSPIVFEERNGKGVCFIFDGLDEFSPLEGEKSIVHKIINKTYLPQSIVIVASRPAALVNLRQKAGKVIEVIGFPKDQIFEYFKNYPFSNTSKAEELKSYLLFHPNVLHMCYLPIHAAMVAFLFEVMGKVPRTETKIYEHFTHLTIIRSLSKHKGQDELEDMGTDKLSGKEKELFDTICKFALAKTIQNEQVLDQDKMELRLQGKGCKDISLGLITVDRTAGLYGFKNIYTFLHLTYQEYLAAHYISTLSDEDQHKLIKQYGDTDHMQVVWKFYCGLVNFEGHEYKIRALANGRNKIGLTEIQCAYESQKEIVCDIFMKEMDAQIILENKYLTITDFTALGYLFANTSMPILLSLTNCSMNIEGFSALLKETEGKSLNLRALCFDSSDILLLEKLIKLLSQQHSLEFLKISYSRKTLHCTTIDKHSFTNIFSTSLANLKELSLTKVPIEPKTLSNVLEFNKGLMSLSLNCCIEKNCIEPLLTGVSKCKKLETVSCSISSFPISGIYSILITINLDNVTLPDFRENSYTLYVQCVSGKHLQTLKLEIPSTVTYFDLESSSYNYWPSRPKLFAIHQPSCRGPSVIPALTQCVSDFSVLEKLILKNLKIIDSDATLLVETLSHCVMLQELDLSHGQTESPEAFTIIFTALKDNSKLQKLVLNDRHIKTDGACVLASCLQHWPKLQELHLRGCGIEEEGAKAIVDNIKYCSELTEVNLTENNISSETLRMIKSNLPLYNEVTESSSPSHNESSLPSEADKVKQFSLQKHQLPHNKLLQPHKSVSCFAVLVISLVVGLLSVTVTYFLSLS